jgi:ribonuclease BN (tRNA processing enzyme)
MKVMLLGTGTPELDPRRMPSGCVIHTPVGPWLVDCGDGTVWQLLRAGIPPQSVGHLIFTHLHSDHTLGYMPFVMGGHLRGRGSLRVWGPARTARMHAMLQDFYAGDGGSDSGLAQVVVTEYRAGTVFEDASLVIDALPVLHSTETYALRFRAAGETIVHSSDTAFCEALIEFARGADILVHSAMAARGMRMHWGRRWDDIHAIMASPAEAGRIARLARVKRLVLVHLPPQADPGDILQECRGEFDGEVFVGEDGLVVECQRPAQAPGH